VAQSILASLPHELANIILFFRCLLTVGLCAGLIATSSYSPSPRSRRTGTK
jgi:hypothetical protein